MAASRSRVMLHRIALVVLLAMLGTGVALRDVEAIGFAVAILAGIFLLAFRKGLLGRIVLGVAFADTIGWMGPAAYSNLRHHDAIAYVALPVGLAAVAAAGLLAAAYVGSRLVPVLIVAVAAVLVLAGAVANHNVVTAKDGDLRLSAKGVRFSLGRLKARNGQLAIVMKNNDLFWHTITIDHLGLDLRVPVGATRRASFEAPAGRYTYYCAIPGHRAAGMEGTLVVR